MNRIRPNPDQLDQLASFTPYSILLLDPLSHALLGGLARARGLGNWPHAGSRRVQSGPSG